MSSGGTYIVGAEPVQCSQRWQSEDVTSTSAIETSIDPREGARISDYPYGVYAWNPMPRLPQEPKVLG